MLLDMPRCRRPSALLPDRPCRLALLDPHPVLRLGVEVLLRQHGRAGRVSLSSEAHLLQLLQRSPRCVDLLLIDALPMGDLGDGLALLRCCRSAGRHCRCWCCRHTATPAR
jgi:DNA-binding NarL/FixJ family response regulator